MILIDPALESETAIHRMVAHCRAGDHPGLVTRLRSGWVAMAERQVFAGYCLLVPDPVVPHLNDLPPAVRAQFLADMGGVGDALLAVTAAVRINYAMFGNMEPALHAHIFPRFADEPQATRTSHPWALDWTSAPEYSEAVYGHLRKRIGAQLSAMAFRA